MPLIRFILSPVLSLRCLHNFVSVAGGWVGVFRGDYLFRQ